MKVFAAALLVSFLPALSAQAYDEAYMTCLVNAERANAGLNPVGIDRRLTAAAQGHSNWMASAQTMSHTGAGGSSPGDRIDQAGFNWLNMGENVAYGYETIEQTMEEWMASPGHRANILSSSFTMMGSAVAYSGRTPYWTQDFGNDGGGARNIPNCSGGSSGGGNGNNNNNNNRQSTPQPSNTLTDITAPATTPARELTPEELGLMPIQPATDGAPSNGPTGPIVVVTPPAGAPAPAPATPNLPVTIPANSSPVSPQELAVMGLSVSPAPAPAPAPTPAPAQASDGPSKPTGKPMTAIVSAQSTSADASAPAAFAAHALSTGPSSSPPSVSAASLDNAHHSPFAPHTVTSEMVAV